MEGKRSLNVLGYLRRRWLNWSLATRFLLVYFLLSTLTVATFTWRSGRQIGTALEEQIEHEQELETLLIANTLSSYTKELGEHPLPPDVLLSQLQRFSKKTETRIVLVDAQLQVVATNDPGIQPGDTFRTPEMVAALNKKERHDIRVDPLTGVPRLFVAAPLLGEENVTGVVQTSIPWSTVQARVVHEWTQLIVTGLLLILANLLVTLWLTRSIVHPLRELTDAARDIASGHFDRRISIASKDEVGILARTFNFMAERLQEMVTRQRMFIANASHELRSPLTSIKLRTEALMEPDDRMSADRRRRFLKEIDAEADRLRRLADRLLDLSRLEMQAERHYRDVVNVSVLIRDAVDVLSVRATKAHIRLDVHLPERLPPVKGESEDMAELFLNLIDNAIKYTPPGGDVRIRADVEGDFVRIAVADTGEGIPPQDIPHIFEPFYRVDKVRSRRIGGSGLGLAIVKTIVDLHGGYIEVESKLGEGTTFTVLLPYVRAS